MHSLLHLQVADEAARTWPAPRRGLPARPDRPPPLRGRAAYVAARLASRLDSESARRAVA